MTDDQKKILDEASQAALKSNKLEDLEKAASIAKLLAEAEKQAADAKNQYNILKNDAIKSWATILVPLLSVITLAVTIWIQTDQLSITKEANEDIAWREAVKSLSTAESTPNGIAAQTLLKPFLTSSRYHQQATELSQLALGQIASHVSFEDLFDSTFGQEPHLSDLAAIKKVDRSLYSNLQELDDKLARNPDPSENPSQPQDPALPPWLQLSQNARASVKVPDRDELQHARDETEKEIVFVCQKMLPLLKEQNDGSAPTLRGIYLMCDLRGVNLNGADLSSTGIAGGVEGVSFKNVTQFAGSWWYNTEWWKAKIISPQLLAMLKDDFYPYYRNDVEYVHRPTKDEYVQDLTRLCNEVGLSCPVKSILFNKKTVRREVGTPKVQPAQKSESAPKNETNVQDSAVRLELIRDHAVSPSVTTGTCIAGRLYQRLSEKERKFLAYTLEIPWLDAAGNAAILPQENTLDFSVRGQGILGWKLTRAGTDAVQLGICHRGSPGCVLLGLSRKPKYPCDIDLSREAVKNFQSRLPQLSRETVSLTVRDKDSAKESQLNAR